MLSCKTLLNLILATTLLSLNPGLNAGTQLPKKNLATNPKPLGLKLKKPSRIKRIIKALKTNRLAQAGIAVAGSCVVLIGLIGAVMHRRRVVIRRQYQRMQDDLPPSIVGLPTISLPEDIKRITKRAPAEQTTTTSFPGFPSPADDAWNKFIKAKDEIMKKIKYAYTGFISKCRCRLLKTIATRGVWWRQPPQFELACVYDAFCYKNHKPFKSAQDAAIFFTTDFTPDELTTLNATLAAINGKNCNLPGTWYYDAAVKRNEIAALDRAEIDSATHTKYLQAADIALAVARQTYKQNHDQQITMSLNAAIKYTAVAYNLVDTYHNYLATEPDVSSIQELANDAMEYAQFFASVFNTAYPSTVAPET